MTRPWMALSQPAHRFNLAASRFCGPPPMSARIRLRRHDHSPDRRRTQVAPSARSTAINRDKRELLSEVTQEMLAPVAARLEAGAGFDESLRQYHQQARSDPLSYQLMFWLAGMGPDETPLDAQPTRCARAPCARRPIPSRPGSQGFPLFPAVAEDHCRLGGTPGDPQQARRAWAVLHGTLTLLEPGSISGGGHRDDRPSPIPTIAPTRPALTDLRARWRLRPSCGIRSASPPSPRH